MLIKYNKSFWVKVILSIFLVFFLCTSCRKAEEVYVPEIGKAFTDFEIKDIYDRNIGTSTLKGRVFILEFWTTWCEPCRLSIPLLSSIYMKYRDRGLEIIAVSLDEGMDNERMRDFVREYSIPYRVAIADNKLRKKFNIYMLPTTFLVDRNGILLNIYRGYIPDMEEIFEKEIEKLI